MLVGFDLQETRQEGVTIFYSFIVPDLLNLVDQILLDLLDQILLDLLDLVDQLDLLDHNLGMENMGLAVGLAVVAVGFLGNGEGQDLGFDKPYIYEIVVQLLALLLELLA